ETHGIESALDGRAVGNIRPGLIDIDAPVAAHDVAAGSVEFAEVAGSAGAEVDDGDAAGLDAFDEGAGIGLGEADVVVTGESADPAVENLNGAGAGGHLHDGEGREDVDDLAHEAAPEGFV